MHPRSAVLMLAVAAVGAVAAVAAVGEGAERPVPGGTCSVKPPGLKVIVTSKGSSESVGHLHSRPRPAPPLPHSSPTRSYQFVISADHAEGTANTHTPDCPQRRAAN